MTQRLVEPGDLMNIAEYEKARPEFRASVMEAKNRRRVTVGEYFTFLFENYTTVLYQIQEMMRVERIVDDKAIAHEIETYNQLIPEPGTLSATLLLEYGQREQREQVLPELRGIDRHVWLKVGDLPPLQAAFDQAQIGDERISSVQYLKFPLEQAHREQWQAAAADGKIRLAVDHPAYDHEAVLPPDACEALAEDLGL